MKEEEKELSGGDGGRVQTEKSLSVYPKGSFTHFHTRAFQHNKTWPR